MCRLTTYIYVCHARDLSHLLTCLSRDLVVLRHEVVYPHEKIVRGGSNQGIIYHLRIRRACFCDHVTRPAVFDGSQSGAVFLPVIIIHITDRSALADGLFHAVCSVVVPIAALSAVKPSVSLVAHARAVEVLNGPAFPHVRLSSAVLRLRDSDLLAGASLEICAARGRRAGDARNGATRTRRQTLRGSAGHRNDCTNFCCCMEHSKNQYHH